MPLTSVFDLIGITQEAVPWAIPVFAASVVIAIAVGCGLQRAGWRAPVGVGAGSPPVSAWLIAGLIVSIGFIVALTLTPNAQSDSVLVDPRSDQGAWGYLREPEFWAHVDSRSLNVVLFIPLGITLALLTRGVARGWALAVGLSVPWLVEGLQVVLPFDRDPQVIDLVDNSTGLVLGFVIGVLITAVISGAPDGARSP